MPARILTAWRALRTGVAFAALGLISLWLGAVWLPFRGLWDRRTPERWRRAQRAIHRAYRLHARLMEALGLVAVRWVGAERLERPGAADRREPPVADRHLLILAACRKPTASWARVRRELGGRDGARGLHPNDVGAEVVRGHRLAEVGRS
jgi:hypothetical protein